MKLKWLIKTPTSFGNSERHSLNVVLFQLLRCLRAQTLCHCSQCCTQITKSPNLFISKNNSFPKTNSYCFRKVHFVTRREGKTWLGIVVHSGNAGAAVEILMLCDAVQCGVLCCVRLCDKGRREHSALSCAVKGTECALIHKPSNCLQTRLQSSSIKTLCLAYQNKSQHRAEYQISPLEQWSTRSLATSRI